MDKFILLRDRTGVCQIKIPEESSFYEKVRYIPSESVMILNGTVKRRPEGQENLKMESGHIEVELDSIVETRKYTRVTEKAREGGMEPFWFIRV